MPTIGYFGFCTLFLLSFRLAQASLLSRQGVNNASLINDLAPSLSPSAELILPQDGSKFTNATLRYTQYERPGIAAVVSAATEEDIVATIQYSNSHGLKFLAQNAGNYWGNMTQTQDGILIDLKRFQNVEIRSTNVTIGAGLIVETLVEKLAAVGKQMRTCNCVGVLGATLGGGHGRLQGMYGLIADNLLEARVILATGEIISVSETVNPELLWALRGAGQNFGIITQATYRIYDQINDGTVYNSDAFYSAEYIPEVFAAMDANPFPAQANAYFIYLNSNLTSFLFINFVFFGPEEQADSLYQSMWGHIPSLSRNATMLAWKELNREGADGFFETGCAARGRRVIAFTDSMTQFNGADMVEAFHTYEDFVSSNPSAAPGSVVFFEAYSLEGVKAIPSYSTAYPNRDAKLLNAVYDDESLDPTAVAWGENLRQIIRRNDGFEKQRIYLNYARGDEPSGAMYGYEPWRVQKLTSLKQRYDPNGDFDGFRKLPTGVW